MDDSGSNRILAALPKLQQFARVVHPEYGATLVEQNQPNDLAYFPHQGAVMSLTRSVANGTQIEVGVIGFEGIGPIASILDPERSIDRAVVQAEGEFSVIPLAALDDEIGHADRSSSPTCSARASRA